MKLLGALDTDERGSPVVVDGQQLVLVSCQLTQLLCLSIAACHGLLKDDMLVCLKARLGNAGHRQAQAAQQQVRFSIGVCLAYACSI